MKKIKLSLACFIAAGMLVACSGNSENTAENTDTDTTQISLEDAELENEEMLVNIDESKVLWEGTMLGVKSHTGWVKLKEGNIVVTDGEISGGSFVVDMTSITPTDSGYDEENTKEKLVGHLSTGDFFLVEEYPTSTFEITGADMDNNKLLGNLTIRGITHEESIDNVKFNREAGTASGELTFDRTDYDVNFKHPAQDMVLSNDISLKIQIKAEDQNS